MQPQLAKQAEVTSLESFIKDDGWVMEQKLDGNRILLVPGEHGPLALTRNGNAYTKALPRTVRDFRFPEGEWALDGELVGDEFWVFDLPAMPSDRGALPLYQRRSALETFIDTISNGFRLVPQAKTFNEKVVLASKAIANDYEGLMMKRRDAVYRPGGRTDEWLKVKFTKTADVIVLDVRDDGKDSVRLGIMSNGTPIDVGRASIIGKEKSGAINVGDVLEVRYLYCNNPDAPRLYQPTILRKRSDKHAHECTDDQLRFTNKTVLSTL